MNTQNLPANPLQALIKKSAATLPATTGNVARYAHRLNPAGTTKIILADISGSMGGVAWGRHIKIDLLREAVQAVMQGAVEPIKLIAFHSCAQECRAIPASPGGSTALHLALDAAAAHNPVNTLVISDGQPDSEALAIAAAERLPGRIDALYIGSDLERSAIDFMRRLATLGCGQYNHNDISRASPALLAHNIQKLIGHHQ